MGRLLIKTSFTSRNSARTQPGFQWDSIENASRFKLSQTIRDLHGSVNLALIISPFLLREVETGPGITTLTPLLSNNMRTRPALLVI